MAILKLVLHHILCFFETQSEIMIRKLYLIRLSINPHIHISRNLFISRSAKIAIVHGGEIFIGTGSQIMDGVMILTYGGKITIGSNCSINPFTVIYGHGDTYIGNNVLIAGGCMIIPANHNFNNRSKKIIEQGLSTKGIIIEDNVWIGHGCSILDGVVVKQGAVIAAGSVITKSVEGNTLVAGVPGRIIKTIE